ncbi:Uncharacterized mitochondrial protein AtMg00310 [Linum grandiflorum]
MSAFLISQSLAEEIERIMNNFWWGTKPRGVGGIPWLRWECLCTRKEYGDMGFRQIHDFNLALLGKQGWKLFSEPNALVISARAHSKLPS